MHFLFEPKTIAVIGASNTQGKVGYTVFKNLKDNPHAKVFPVNIKHTKVQGINAYPSVLDIPGHIDLAIVAVPPTPALSVMTQCAQKGVKACVVLTSNLEIPTDLLTQVTKNTRILGPNCLGIINAHYNLNATFLDMQINQGNISLVMQSGAYATYVLDVLNTFGVGVDIYASLGNKVDLTENHILEYLSNRPQTKVIGLYLENIDNAQKLKQLLITLNKTKRVVALLSGQTKAATQSQVGHTGRMLADFEQTKALLRDTGTMVVHTPELFAQALYIASVMPINKQLNSTVIITNAGGPAVTITDLFEQHNIRVLPAKGIENQTTGQSISDTIKTTTPNANIHQVIDLQGNASPADFRQALNVVSSNIESPNTFITTIYTPQGPTRAEELINITRQAAKGTASPPVLTILLKGRPPQVSSTANRPVAYTSCPSLAIKVLSSLKNAIQISKLAQQRLSHKAKGVGSIKVETYEDIRKIIQALKIPTPPELIIYPNELNDQHALLVKLKRFMHVHPTVVIKPYLPNTAHLNKLGLVKTNITTPNKALKTLLDLHNRIQQDFNSQLSGGVLRVQKQIHNDLEIFFGIKRNKQLPTDSLTIGWGGVFANYLQGTYTLDLPTTIGLIEHGLKQTKIYKLLEERFTAVLPALIKTIHRLSLLSLILDDFTVIDINPVIINTDGVYVVDLKIFNKTKHDQTPSS